MGVKITLLNGKEYRCNDEELVWDNEAHTHTISKKVKDAQGISWDTIIEIPQHAVATIEHFEKTGGEKNG